MNNERFAMTTLGMPGAMSGCLSPRNPQDNSVFPADCIDETLCRPPEQIRCILERIDVSENDKENWHYADLLGIPCGIGKSTAVSWKIAETLKRNDGNGLIAVTDDIERLSDYLKPTDERLAKYLADNKDRITLMDASNAQEAHSRQMHTPVLLMSTQRFLSMPKDRFAEYLAWEGGDRPLLLFDERLPLREVAIISLADINDISTMLTQGIDNTANQVEKRWCMEQWERVRARYGETFSRFENAHPEERVSSFFYYNQQTGMTENDERFWRFIRSNRVSLMAYRNGRALKSLEHVFRIEKEGALYQGRRGKEYSNKLAICLDHRDKLTNLNAKVIVMDGTADLHPDYRQDFIRRISLNGYPLLQRTLERLTIRTFNVPTSKCRLFEKESGKRLQQCICHEIARMAGEGTFDTPIFTYTELERFFRKSGFVHVEHFGDIKGSNRYREQNLIIQIGLNRCEPLYYDAYALYSDPQRIERLRTMTMEESAAAIKEVLENQTALRDLMNRMILADVEQNLFRGSIRNNDCPQEFEYWMFINSKEYRELLDLMTNRYGPLCADVCMPVELTAFKEFKSMVRKTEKATTVQMYSRYIDNLQPGTHFTRSDILRTLNITASAFCSMMRTHPQHKARLEQMRVPGKKRVYCKPL